jgi:hypothetical protein
MGIRFACPNGHPLHVKAELAGKRGICPECQVRFVIPAPTGAATSPTPRAPAAPVVAQSTVAPAPEPKPPAQPKPAGAAEPQPEQKAAAQPAQPAGETPVWYVRPSVGGQFGPADDTLIRQWAAEGRVGAEAYVWRTGWPEWRRASELAEYFPHLAQPVVAAAPHGPAGYNDASGVHGGSGSAPADVSVATARYQRRKQRSARSQLLAAVVLIVLAVALAVVLVWVVMKTGTAPPESVPEPAPPNVPANNADATEEPDEPTMNAAG